MAADWKFSRGELGEIWGRSDDLITAAVLNQIAPRDAESEPAGLSHLYLHEVVAVYNDCM
jgi:hypothetical protein